MATRRRAAGRQPHELDQLDDADPVDMATANSRGVDTWL